ncbi:transposase [Arenibaculum pallidiluteum]|uniref:transposase n=1 Tax=Arenibaculum pallidiluteum TaxID=2812559 RepID=UPI001A956AB1|nr:transposase [Arenibaculum pallidiluteum]
MDSVSVRAKRGGELTGPNPTDRGKPGPKYHMVVSTDGLPVAAVASAANVPDTKLFPELLRLAQVACAAIGNLYADAGYDSRDNRWRRLRKGIRPTIRKGGSGHGSGLGVVRSVVERVIERLIRYRCLDRRQDRSSIIIRSLLVAACIFILAGEITDV